MCRQIGGQGGALRYNKWLQRAEEGARQGAFPPCCQPDRRSDDTFLTAAHIASRISNLSFLACFAPLPPAATVGRRSAEPHPGRQPHRTLRVASHQHAVHTSHCVVGMGAVLSLNLWLLRHRSSGGCSVGQSEGTEPALLSTADWSLRSAAAVKKLS